MDSAAEHSAERSAEIARSVKDAPITETHLNPSSTDGAYIHIPSVYTASSLHRPRFFSARFDVKIAESFHNDEFYFDSPKFSPAKFGSGISRGNLEQETGIVVHMPPKAVRSVVVTITSRRKILPKISPQNFSPEILAKEDIAWDTTSQI